VAAILRDVATGVEWRLDEGSSWIVGGTPGCDVVLDDPACGRRHVQIEFASGGWRALLLANGGSAFAINGISVGRDELRRGDVLRVGNTLLRFELDDVPPAADGKAVASRREPLAMPQSFEALHTLFTAPCPTVDAALVAARAGEGLLRFCEIDDPRKRRQPSEASLPPRKPCADRRARLGEAFQMGLASPWPVVRAVSAHGFAALAVFGGSSATLVSLVSHADASVRTAAARGLAAVDPLEAAPRIHALAPAPPEACDATDAAEYAAQLHGIGDDSLLDDLLRRAATKAFDESRASARICAAAVLGEIGSPGAVRPLRTLLFDAAEEVRAAAVDALRRAANDDARDALRSAIADSSPRVFQAATRALAGSHDPLLAELLKKALRATDPADLERRARYRRALEDVTGERRGPDPDSWL